MFITPRRQNLLVTDLTPRIVDGTLNVPITLSDAERFSVGELTTELAFSLTRYSFKGAYSAGGLGPHVPVVWLKGAEWDTVLCTNGTAVTIDRVGPAEDADSVESNLLVVGTNGNFGGVGQPATPPHFSVAPVGDGYVWTFVLTKDDDNGMTFSVTSDDPLYAGVSWERSMVKAGFMAGAAEVWFGVIDPVVQKRLYDYGYSGQYEIGRGVAGPVLTAYTV